MRVSVSAIPYKMLKTQAEVSTLYGAHIEVLSHCLLPRRAKCVLLLGLYSYNNNFSTDRPYFLHLSLYIFLASRSGYIFRQYGGR